MVIGTHLEGDEFIGRIVLVRRTGGRTVRLDNGHELGFSSMAAAQQLRTLEEVDAPRRRTADGGWELDERPREAA